MTLISPTDDPAVQHLDLPIEWMRVQAGLWVGRCRGEFAGMIENREGQFAAIKLGTLMGTYDSLADAKGSFR